MAYGVSGGEKVALFLHGGSADRCAGLLARFWPAVAAAGFDVLALDFPGSQSLRRLQGHAWYCVLYKGLSPSNLNPPTSLQKPMSNEDCFAAPWNLGAICRTLIRAIAFEP